MIQLQPLSTLALCDSSTPFLAYLMLLCYLMGYFKTDVGYLWIIHCTSPQNTCFPCLTQWRLLNVIYFWAGRPMLPSFSELFTVGLFQWVHKQDSDTTAGRLEDYLSPSIWTRVPTCPPHSSKFCISLRNCRIHHSGFGSLHRVLFNFFLYSVFHSYFY